jgi:Leucine-rich repeat (LRR) protein
MKLYNIQIGMETYFDFRVPLDLLNVIISYLGADEIENLFLILNDSTKSNINWSFVHNLHFGSSGSSNFVSSGGPSGSSGDVRYRKNIDQKEHVKWLKIKKLKNVFNIGETLDKIDKFRNLVSNGINIIPKEIPKEIGVLINLEELYFNGIDTIPDSIADLVNLRELHITGGNRIWEIPASITALTNLRVLNLSNNEIQVIPPTITGLKNLRELNLGNNIIGRIPVEIADLMKLEILDLTHNPIKGIFPERIKYLHNLHIIYIGFETYNNWNTRTRRNQNIVLPDEETDEETEDL